VIPRWAILRGDATALAVAMLGLGALLIALAVGDGRGAEAGAGLLSLLGGGFLLRTSRTAWRAEIARVAAAHAGHDPGDSPVAWIADVVWREANGFDPELDAINELVAEVDPSVPRFADSARGGLESPCLRLVQDAERAMASEDASATAGGTALPPSGAPDVLLAALRATPGRLIGVSVRWPVCCGGLTVLTSRDPTAPLAGAVWLGDRVTPIQPGDAVPVLPHRFLCRHCGRRYATEPAWNP
jgi:hypothetical protein